MNESRKKTNRKSFIDKNEMEQQIIRAKWDRESQKRKKEKYSHHFVLLTEAVPIQ